MAAAESCVVSHGTALLWASEWALGGALANGEPVGSFRV